MLMIEFVTAVQLWLGRNMHLKLLRTLVKRYGFVPDKFIMDELRSYCGPCCWGRRTP